MSLVKTSRLRKTISTTDVTKTISGGDIKLEIYLETKTENGTPPVSYEEWELKFITLDLPADVPMTKKYSNKDSRYGANQKEVLDFIVPDFIQLATLTKLRALSYTQAEAAELSKSYYGLIQDPFSEQAPLTRNYGTDGYFLNNGTEVLVRWNTGASVSFWDTKYVEAEIRGVNYSLADGSEGWDQSLSLPGSTPSVPFIQTPEDMEFAKGEKKKIFKYVFAYNGTQSYMLSSGQIKLYEKPNEPDFFPGEVKDLDLVTKLVDLWKTKVPNYDLKISNPNYQAGSSLEFKDPLQGLSPSTAVADNTGSSVSTADEVKFELSIVYDKNVVIKADRDLPNIEIYVGKPPAAGEFLFDEDEFDDLALLDEEYTEAKFEAHEESWDEINQTYSKDSEEMSINSDQELKEYELKNEKLELSGEGNGPGCPALPGKLKGTVVTSKVVGDAYGSYAKGLDVYIAKLDIAFNNFISEIKIFNDYKPKGGKVYKNALVGDSWRSFAVQKKKYEEFVAKGRQGANKAPPCNGYHVAGQAVDLNQGGSYTTKDGKNVTLLKDITTHGILYKSLYRAGLRRISNEWWHWSLGETDHDINKQFVRNTNSPGDETGFTKY